jgi:xanthine/CO dehydrogenase XdhC/CoxF family maturation factor
VRELAAILGRLETAGPAPRVLATLVSVEGSSYRRAGARALFEADGGRLGSVSGGCLEEDISERARAVAASGRAELATYDTTSENDLVWGTGAGCHGVVRVLLERLAIRPDWAARLAENLRAGKPTDLAVVWQAGADGPALGTVLGGELPDTAGGGIFRQTIPPAPALAIFGAGDDAQPLARGAAELGWRVTVADPRPAFATAARFPGAVLVVAPAGELVARAAPPADALAVVMTHHYRHDLPVLRDLLPRSLAYLGLLGPRPRTDRMLAALAADGLAVTPAQRSRLHAPVGLDLGAEAPEEVALSILAEMRAALSGRDARPLRERTGPIHG